MMKLRKSRRIGTHAAVIFNDQKQKQKKKSIKLSKFEPLDPLTPSLFYLFHGEWCLGQF